MQGVGFEPTKHYALELESNPFDRSGTLANSAHGMESNHRPLGYEPSALTTALPCDFIKDGLIMMN